MNLIKSARCVSVEATSRTTWQHLVLEAGRGHRGYGECTLEGASADFAAFIRREAEKIVGPDAHELLDVRPAADLSDIRQAAAWSAIDQAMNDLRARQSGEPLWRWLNPAAELKDVALYANINRRSAARTPECFRESAQEAFAAGFTAVKIAPFDGLERGSPDADAARLIKLAMTRVEAVSDVMPEGGELQIDCHWRLTRHQALEILPLLSKLGVTWFECPVPETADLLDEIVDIRHAANACGIRLAGCETLGGWAGFRPFVEGGCYDVIMPDVKYVGGFSALRQIVDEARRRGVAVSLHNPSGPVCHAHSLHASIALGLEERLEVQFDETPLFGKFTEPALSTRAPTARPPEGTGIGIRLLDELRPVEGPNANTQPAGVH